MIFTDRVWWRENFPIIFVSIAFISPPTNTHNQSLLNQKFDRWSGTSLSNYEKNIQVEIVVLPQLPLNLEHETAY